MLREESASGVQRSREISVEVRLGNQASRKVSHGTQGTDRGRKAPAGTFQGSPIAFTGFGSTSWKVGAGGDTSPHFRIGSSAAAQPWDGADAGLEAGRRVSSHRQSGIEINPACPASGSSRLVTTAVAAPSSTLMPRRRT